MSLEFLEVACDYNINTEINIKESRKIRKQKIERKQEFHKKNPKSLAYHASMDILNNALQDMIPTGVIATTSNINNLLNEEPAKASKILIVSQDNMKDDTMDLTIEKFDTVTDNTSVNKPSIDPIEHTPSSGKNSSLHMKTKTQLQMMFQSLQKILKKEGVFLETTPQFDTISAMKDYNVQTNIGKQKTSLSLRAIVGEYTNFKNLVLQNHGNFSLLKNDFQDWWNANGKNFDAKAVLDHKMEEIFTKYNQLPQFKKFLPNLEAKLISVLKKPTKQPNGFLHKIQQIDSLWVEEAQEIYHIEQIENQLNFKSYEASFPLARSIRRKFSIYIGKTNSGKTYAAMNELAKGRHGTYLAPLRLMAQEGQESLVERDVLTDLITGEEQRKHPDSTHVSSTVEMCNMNKFVDVAVIDEIQMISDESRGWAWSQALIGVPAAHVILVGSEEALPFIIPILEELEEPYEITRFERKTPLDICEPIWKLKELKADDCVVVFSRKSALEMKNAIEATGKRCSVIYGNLSPDVRRSEAKKFKSGENPILVATDAIGMGLNLPIKRIYFSSLEKFDGTATRYLNSSEIKQIAGRAGRFGLAEKGQVGILFNESHSDTTRLHKAIYGDYDKPTDTRIPIAPNLKQIQTICNTLGKQDLYSALIFFKEKLIRDNKLYKAANLESMIEIASLIKNKNLDLATGLNYACVPLDTNSEIHTKTFFKWLNTHISGNENIAPSLPDVVLNEKNDSYSLYEAENYVKLLMAYRWLHYKYPEFYCDIENATHYAKITNTFIEQALHRHVIISKNPRWRR
jgi:hypothetical protein